ncbi:unnamed protein product [Tilletia controversa]|uniref:CRAL-TRIO domain-containing protein n=3 Tax=Tilletia TaxID=13289 RepID=A0A8X7SYQ5_9BASI|nr:hypothetical protein CF336_g2236 [Tilletia laevis]KAE8200030.1 hypothetical protein CF328_g3078 [Tilletia controversa]KAE8262576.1 hypothetical protein A4X03_0g2351 [Tilletia caries]KAE8205764.1 hypothetical protein CF335_g2195 [Tilletia laevis]KAE8252319.1 hypothetical protein A4X06_0g2278 [Tilletia controversa]
MSFLFARRPGTSRAPSIAPSVADADVANGSTTPAPETENKPAKTHSLLLTPPADIEVEALPPLSSDRQSQVDDLRKHLVELHHEGLAQDDPYYGFEEAWIHEVLLPERYLGAVNWDLAAAKVRIKATLEWRRSFQPECISPDEVKPEALTGKHFIGGFDKQGRPILTVTPRNENTKSYDRQLRYMVWSFERCIQLMPKGVFQLNLVMDLEGNNAANNPPMSTSRAALNIMQNHYPNRLARAICNRGPWFFTLFFRVVSPFVDPITRQKILFNPSMTSLANPDQIATQWEGGEYDYEWDFDSYWSQLLDYCGVNPDGSRVSGPVPVDQNKTMGLTGAGPAPIKDQLQQDEHHEVANGTAVQEA